jgi:hypothetical protein
MNSNDLKKLINEQKNAKQTTEFSKEELNEIIDFLNLLAQITIMNLKKEYHER